MIVIISGGSASGKSEFAESVAMGLGKKRVYIATMEPFGDESLIRIARHREMRREKGFETAEIYTGLKDAPLPECDVILLECMSNLLANEMYSPAGAGENCVESIIDGIERLSEIAGNIVIVTNEVFSDGCVYDESTAKYIEILGEINRRLAKRAEAFVEVVASIPIVHKATTCGKWESVGAHLCVRPQD